VRPNVSWVVVSLVYLPIVSAIQPLTFYYAIPTHLLPTNHSLVYFHSLVCFVVLYGMWEIVLVV